MSELTLSESNFEQEVLKFFPALANNIFFQDVKNIAEK